MRRGETPAPSRRPIVCRRKYGNVAPSAYSSHVPKVWLEQHAPISVRRRLGPHDGVVSDGPDTMPQLPPSLLSFSQSVAEVSGRGWNCWIAGAAGDSDPHRRSLPSPSFWKALGRGSQTSLRINELDYATNLSKDSLGLADESTESRISLERSRDVARPWSELSAGALLFPFLFPQLLRRHRGHIVMGGEPDAWLRFHVRHQTFQLRDSRAVAADERMHGKQE